MKKLIEALHVIQDECKKHDDCECCPLYVNLVCGVNDLDPDNWKINDEAQKALL